LLGKASHVEVAAGRHPERRLRALIGELARLEPMIPPTAHFVWIGRELAYVHVLAVASAAFYGGFERVLFHHTDELEGDPHFRELERIPGVEARQLAPQALLEAAGGARLVDCYRALARPAAQSNLIRVGLLHESGGVYLDADTVTCKSFAPLLAAGGVFCGEERLVFPVDSAGLLARIRPSAIARVALRDTLRRVPAGFRWFRHVAQHYPARVNNAVLGSERRHAFMEDLIARMRTFPAERRRVRYALGTHLLQTAVAEWRGADLQVLPPPAFFPLGPEISEHWFRMRPSVDLGEAVTEETYLVHWYASVRSEPHVARLTPEFVRKHARSQLFSALALPTVEALGGPLGGRMPSLE
jgi:hypothetical protein